MKGTTYSGNYISIDHRIAAFESGGVHFASSTSLVMDMLYKRIPYEDIDGFLVPHAER